jgi:hypothetical protein
MATFRQKFGGVNGTDPTGLKITAIGYKKESEP